MTQNATMRVISIAVGVLVSVILTFVFGLSAFWSSTAGLTVLLILRSKDVQATLRLNNRWSSHGVPSRRWPAITIDLGKRLTAFRNDWFTGFQRDAVARGLRLRPALSKDAVRFISVLQIGAVLATITENGYAKTVKDAMFISECVYILLMNCPPQQLHTDIENAPFALMSGDLRQSIETWARVIGDMIAEEGSLAEPRSTSHW